MKDVVVLAGTAPWSVLSLCRIAFNHGAKAYCICIGLSHPMDYSSSKYVTASYTVEPEMLQSFWGRFFEDHRFLEKPLLFAVYDEGCILIDENRSFYDRHFQVSLPSSKIVKTFNDKSLAGEMAKTNGLTVPKTETIKDYRQVEDVCKSFTFPVIVKPTTATEHFFLKFKMKVFENASDFKSFSMQLLQDNHHFVCQEYINGEDKDCKFYIFYRNGNGDIVECMGEKTLQSNGIMTVGTTRFDEDMSNLCRSFIDRIGYEGIGGIEFKLCNGVYYFIEMSTRTEGFVAISDMAGVSLSEAAFLDNNGKTITDCKQKEDVKYIEPVSFIINRLNNKRYLSSIAECLSFVFDRKAHFVNSYLGTSLFNRYRKR